MPWIKQQVAAQKNRGIARWGTLVAMIVLLGVGAAALAFVYLVPSGYQRQERRWREADEVRRQRRAYLAAEKAEAAAFDRQLAAAQEQEEAQLAEEPPKKARRKRRARRRKKPVIIRHPARRPTRRPAPTTRQRSVRGTVITMYMTPT